MNQTQRVSTARVSGWVNKSTRDESVASVVPDPSANADGTDRTARLESNRPLAHHNFKSWLTWPYVYRKIFPAISLSTQPASIVTHVDRLPRKYFRRMTNTRSSLISLDRKRRQSMP